MTKQAPGDRPSERGDGASPLPRTRSSHFGAARVERDGPSPLPDDMRCPLGTDQGGTVEVLPPLTRVRGGFSFGAPGERSSPSHERKGEHEMPSSPFCTCGNMACPLHPAKHDRGCAPCIQKNLRLREVPNCFFNLLDHPEGRPA